MNTKLRAVALFDSFYGIVSYILRVGCSVDSGIGAKEDPAQKMSAFGRITRIYVGFKDLGGAAGKIEVNRRADS
jgi:hypothetical protein